MTPEEEKRKERRTNWPQEIGPGFWLELQSHMHGEEEKFKTGEARMDRIEADLRPIKKIYWVGLGAVTVGGALIALLIYIYQHDKDDLREMRLETKELASAIYKQGVVMERMLTAHQMLEVDYRRTVDRLDRNDDRANAARAGGKK